MDQTFRQRFPPTPLIGPEKINWTYEQANIDKASEKFSLIPRQDYGDTRPKTVFTPQLPTLIRDEIVYSKLYHLVTWKDSNINGNSEKDMDLSEHICERLKQKQLC